MGELMAIEILGYDIEKSLPLVGLSLWNIIVFVSVLIIGLILIKIFSIFIRKSLTKAKMDQIVINFITRIFRFLLLIFLAGISLGFLGFSVGTAFISFSVVLGFVLGFAFEDSLRNIAAGFLIATTKPFTKDDYVKINGMSGIIKSVGINVTEMDTLDNRHISIANKLVWSGNVINYTKNKLRRVDMEIGVGYNDDLDKVIKITMNIIKSNPKILKKPAPQVSVKDMADSSVVMVIRPWTKSENYWDVFFDVKKSLKEGYDKAGISIPFPQLDIHHIEGDNNMEKVK